MVFHHFVGPGLNRSEKIQAWIIDQLLRSKLPPEKRESSVPWEFKHSSGVIQLARLLAQKRGIDQELAEIAAGLHDIYVIVHGSYDRHATRGAPIAQKVLEDSGQFSRKEIQAVTAAVAAHSDKQVYSSIPLVELVKDADCFDCFFYGDNIYDYKPPELLAHYYKRIIEIRREFGLQPKRYFGERLGALERSK